MPDPREAHYLCAVLNSGVTTELVRPLMSYGKDERDIHKHVWELPIPEFDPASESHAELASLGEQAAMLAADAALSADLHFAAQRRQIRKTLVASGVSAKIDQIVVAMLS